MIYTLRGGSALLTDRCLGLDEKGPDVRPGSRCQVPRGRQMVCVRKGCRSESGDSIAPSVLADGVQDAV